MSTLSPSKSFSSSPRVGNSWRPSAAGRLAARILDYYYALSFRYKRCKLCTLLTPTSVVTPYLSVATPNSLLFPRGAELPPELPLPRGAELPPPRGAELLPPRGAELLRAVAPLVPADRSSVLCWRTRVMMDKRGPACPHH